MPSQSSIEHHSWWKKIKNHRYIRFFLFLIFGLITFGLLASNVIPDNIDIEAGAVSTQDIRSPVTIEKTEETERIQQEAAESVEPVYTLNARYADNQMERINDVFHSIRLIQLEVREQRGDFSNIGDAEAGVTQDEDQNVWTMEERIEELQARLSPELGEQLSEETLQTLLNASSEELQVAQEATTSAVYDVMTEEVGLGDVSEARENAEEKVRAASVRAGLSDAMTEVARRGITANYMIDEEATQEARQSAAEMIEPAMIREGQLLVEEGQVITAEVYEDLSLVGLTDDNYNYSPLLGLAMLVFLMMFVLALYLNKAKTSLQSNNTHLLLFMLVYALTLILMKLTSFLYQTDLPGVSYIVPAAAGTILVAMLLQSRVALFMSFLLSIAASIIFNQQTSGMMDYSFGLFVFFSGIAGVFFLNQSNRVSHMLKTGTLISLINLTIVMALILLKSLPLSIAELGMYAGYAVTSGYLSIILAVGLLPFFEAGFGVLSTSKLIELSNPNKPLLRKILLEAPGTYHHSVVVANLAEGACEAIGANGLLARVGAYYHDIGKTKKPQFFIENQMKIENPHDKIPPKKSAEIIIAHPYEGADMLRREKFPKEIIEIAEQHHGTTLLKYFYFKAKEAGEKVSENEFRYPGPRAQTKEIAIVGIADSVEAAVRSMQSPTFEKIEDLVRKIMNDRLEDGQFDECDITLKELHKVFLSICETLKGTFHSRIDYPDDEDMKKVEGE
ncbi:HD family phosphohydrolase [Alkalicoccus daliensis]|uniref:HD/PDEase domain-containing protein n=1 Tax=Alkalicoccus daliensis TaxID=745820 RepID=A0A1H0BCR0_9BACI|nr:HD family phosphohydrolase [Alkalicoccus daliensis]SDN43462.1 hypothetical protein SAMN04488053_101843 [Alkalicoccus daliensis]